jgi:hypothetical protein
VAAIKVKARSEEIFTGDLLSKVGTIFIGDTISLGDPEVGDPELGDPDDAGSATLGIRAPRYAANADRTARMTGLRSSCKAVGSRPVIPPAGLALRMAIS